MNWDLTIQIIGMVLAVWGAAMSYRSYAAKQAERLEEKKVNAAMAMKAMEKELGNLQFSQMRAEVDACKKLFDEAKRALKENVSELRDANKNISENEKRLIKLTEQVKGFVEVTQKRLDDLYGRVIRLENKGGSK